MYIEIEAPSQHTDKEDQTFMYIGPFPDQMEAQAAIDQAPNVTWEPERRVTGNGIMLMARAIGPRRHRYPVVPYIPHDRDEFALLAYQYA